MHALIILLSPFHISKLVSRLAASYKHEGSMWRATATRTQLCLRNHGQLSVISGQLGG